MDYTRSLCAIPPYSCTDQQAEEQCSVASTSVLTSPIGTLKTIRPPNSRYSLCATSGNLAY